jgi:5'-methylthioadenosine phosphorylase
VIGIIGGSGLYRMEALRVLREERLTTPFGEPSDAYILGELEGREVVFLSRHGQGHTILPTEINFRANLWGLKTLGCDRVVSVSAVGSMKDHLRPTDVVLPDQFVDRTRHRPDTFFGRGIAAHVSLAHPVCPELQAAAYRACASAGARVHRGGTYLCMEGPQFSTRAESFLYRSWGVDVIGMTNLQEARLSREAEMCYATLAMVTDYDCWHEEEENVTTAAILEVIAANARLSQEILRETVKALPREHACACATALDAAVVTRLDRVPPETLEALVPILKEYRRRQGL